MKNIESLTAENIKLKSEIDHFRKSKFISNDLSKEKSDRLVKALQ
jgi:hypothetical protein